MRAIITQRNTETKLYSKFEENRIFEMENKPRLCPELAAEIGLNESILLLQLEFWIATYDHQIDGHRWMHQSVPELHKFFPCWSETTIKRIIKSLKKQNLILTGNYNKARYDKTNWYAINVAEAAKLKSVSIRPEVLSDYGILEANTIDKACYQFDSTAVSSWNDLGVNLNRPIPETTSENTPESTSPLLEVGIESSKATSQNICDDRIGAGDVWADVLLEEGLDQSSGGVNESSSPEPPRVQSSIEDDVVRDVLRVAEKQARNLFQSVGVTNFDMTIGGTGDVPLEGVIGDWRPNVDLDKDFDELYTLNERERRSLILRPRGAPLIQIDDCDFATVEMLYDFAFFGVETSPKNYQVWLALPQGTETAELEETRSRLMTKIDTGNGGSHGSVRWVGSVNCKPKHNGFRVSELFGNEGRITSKAELERAGLLAARPESKTQSPKRTHKNRRHSGLPDWEKCEQWVRDNPTTRSGKYDVSRSRVEWRYAVIAAQNQLALEEIVKGLMANSGRSQERGLNHAVRTVTDALRHVGLANGFPRKGN